MCLKGCTHNMNSLGGWFICRHAATRELDNSFFMGVPQRVNEDAG